MAITQVYRVLRCIDQLPVDPAGRGLVPSSAGAIPDLCAISYLNRFSRIDSRTPTTGMTEPSLSSMVGMLCGLAMVWVIAEVRSGGRQHLMEEAPRVGIQSGPGSAW